MGSVIKKFTVWRGGKESRELQQLGQSEMAAEWGHRKWTRGKRANCTRGYPEQRKYKTAKGRRIKNTPSPLSHTYKRNKPVCYATSVPWEIARIRVTPRLCVCLLTARTSKLVPTVLGTRTRRIPNRYKGQEVPIHELKSRKVYAERVSSGIFSIFRLFFYVFLTVHLSISLDNDQLDTHLLYFTILYYNPLHVSSIICSSPGGWIVLMQHLVSSLSVSGLPVHRLRDSTPFCLNLCTGRPLTENDDTRCSINTIQPPDDEHIMLETCRGL